MAGRGYTLIEVAVAATVLAIGVLAAAASAVPVSRLIREGGAVSAAAAVAAARIETMRAAGCARLAAGAADVAGGYRLTWTVAPSGSLRAVTVVVRHPAGGATRSDVFGTLLRCPP